ncbi:DUF4349 domain-containing protein [Sedimentibacter sp. zth1]|uniref:DUF4349 domain-containing protein n=1 Tax=Sedimentibacter sp. zth1 TaxID=2816908 RepID=UPI001A913A78|nr:DUF4349 domain-containing protein [Sedimentibacter sp. zth1]QSX07337.1 DUF4349 domain-containing protein [Sedimentibacter sp. zth1]
MNCSEFRDLIFSFLDGELSLFEKEQFEQHLSQCDDCKLELEAYKKLIEEIQKLPMEELPIGYCKKLHKGLEKAVDDKHRIVRNRFIKYISIAATCILVVTGVYFASNGMNGNMNGDYDKSLDMGNRADDSNYGEMYDNANKETEQMVAESPQDIDANYSNDEDKQLSMTNSIQNQENRTLKIIKSCNIETTTLEYKSFLNSLLDLTRKSDGYIEYNRTYTIQIIDDKEYKGGNVKVRVPEEHFYNVINFIKSESDVTNEVVNENDVTKHYYDIDNIVKNLKIQEDRLRELYSKATNVTEILQLENEIRRIRTEIDSYSITLSDIDDRVSMSTIELNIIEVEGKSIDISSSKSVWQKSKEGIIKTINNIVKLLQNFVIYLITYLPYIIVIAILVIVLTLITKRKTKK